MLRTTSISSESFQSLNKGKPCGAFHTVACIPLGSIQICSKSVYQIKLSTESCDSLFPLINTRREGDAFQLLNWVDEYGHPRFGSNSQVRKLKSNLCPPCQTLSLSVMALSLSFYMEYFDSKTITKKDLWKFHSQFLACSQPGIVDTFFQ